MEVGSGLVDAVSALLAGTGIVLFARLMGLATGYRGILWRRPKGYVPENPVRQAVLSFLSPDHGILALGRLLGYVIEAQGLLVVLIGFWELAHWAMGHGLRAVEATRFMRPWGCCVLRGAPCGGLRNC